MTDYGNWERIEKLGEGGQSEVYLARSPARVAERRKCLGQIQKVPEGTYGLQPINVISPARTVDSPFGLNGAELANAIWSYARPDKTSELGALKIFKIREGGAPAKERLRREVSVLRENRPHLPKLLDANEDEEWIVTEYFPGKTLAESPDRFKGNLLSALRTFRILVETVATSLHKDKIVHRDLKPANVFIGADGSLIPGDFGIVYLPDERARLTVTQERVGPRDYMPQWADLGVRLEDVDPRIDVYMLGKLLWCMVSGRLRLPREYHRRSQFDLTRMFPNNNYMHLVNSLLDRCLVETPEECFLASAEDVLKVVDKTLSYIEDGVPFVDQNGRLILPCRMCGRGFYQVAKDEGAIRLTRYDNGNRQLGDTRIQAFVCNVCAHYAFFAPGYPNEAASRDWEPWAPPSGRKV